jgi:hypothetical protein
MSAPERIWVAVSERGDMAMNSRGEKLNDYFEHVEYTRADLVLSDPRAVALVEALRWYASDAAWTVYEVEGPHGDYGQKARAALAALDQIKVTHGGNAE